ncbi:MAG: porin family protein [Agarilytica sp.]
MRVLLVAAAMLLASSAFAQSKFDRLDKFYVGGVVDSIDAGQTAANGKAGGFTALELIGGYKYNGYLSGELRLGTGMKGESFAGGTQSDITSIVAAYWRPETANETAKIYGLVGVASVSVDVEAADASDTNSETGLSYGFGVGFRYLNNWNINIEYKSLIDASDTDFEAVSAGIDYRF